MSDCVQVHRAASEAVACAAREEIRLASRPLGDDLFQTDLSVPGVHCAHCIRSVETGLQRLAGVEAVRVNLSTRRASVKWRGQNPPDLLGALDELGFAGHLTEADTDRSDPELGRLIRALAVAGFSAMNIMLLSVSVWSGAEAPTRHAFHWISAALALPCLLYSGRIFFLSAWSALKCGRTNMDVPISIGVCLAFGLSLYDTVHNGPHAYFDAATSLIFFLLIGRALDHVMREKTRTAVRGLARLEPRGATVLREDGRRDYVQVEAIAPGMRILLAAGDRVPVDASVEQGIADMDCSIATGESAAKSVGPGSPLQAGMLALSGPLVVSATARSDNSFLAVMVRLMEAAEGGRARYRRLADRAAALYAPVVHATAFASFLGWLAATGDWHTAITIAIAVLIITCPCALGLAVPIVQVVAARRLFDNGIMVKDGSALERMAEIDTVAFDKTGTLTRGKPRLVNAEVTEPRFLAIAAGIAALSKHPLSQAIAAEGTSAHEPPFDVAERAGLGIEARLGDDTYRLGRADWAVDNAADAGATGTVLSRNGECVARFDFEDTPRPRARESVDALRRSGLHIAMLSGDEPSVVVATAARLGIDDCAARLLPAEKVARLEGMASDGRKVLMVGDGLNDAPALAAAHVSMAPANAADIGRRAADFVFLHNGLDAVPSAFAISRQASRLVRQNFALAIAYNAIALPIAIAGYVTPLIAALAMSFSSVLVVGNALRLKSGGGAHHAADFSLQGARPPLMAQGAAE
jgi:Cu2+-exporting ATPase